MSENTADMPKSPESPKSTMPRPEVVGNVERKNPINAYIGSEYLSMLRSQEKEGREPVVLFTDIDNTFFRKDRARESGRLFEDLQKDSIPVVSVTGNSFLDIEKRIQAGELPYFSIIAGAVGTEIYVLHKKDGGYAYKKDEAYEEKLHEKGYSRRENALKAQEMVEDFGGKNKEYQEPHPEWQLDFQQPKEEQDYREGKIDAKTQFKISFDAFASSDVSLEALKTEVAKRFPSQKIVFCEAIHYNSNMQQGDANKKYNIDILPVTKADAVSHISDTTGAKMRIIAGDSGNDIEMLTGVGDISITVGGAKPELTAAVNNIVSATEENKHFQRVIGSDGNMKLYSREKGTGLGPDSIRRTIKHYQNAKKLNLWQKFFQSRIKNQTNTQIN